MTARLRILMETVPDTDVVASMLPAFRAEHPDLAVDVEAMHYDDMSGPTLASLRADEPDLDLVILDNPWVEGLVGAGQLEPLEERIAGAPGIDWDGYYPALRSAPELAGRFALAPIPGGASVLGVWYWAIPANARDKEAAWAFIAWIAANERERVARGGAPVSGVALTDPGAWADGLDPAAYYQPFDTLHAGARPLVVGPNAENVIVAVGEELHPAVAGIIGVDEAVTRAARRAEALLAG
jgi:ABC-type glycerol-3-phosphate transport system substrate-binding protein